MYHQLNSIHEADLSGFDNRDFFITGSIDKHRPSECIKTPEKIARRMVIKLELPDAGGIVFEPCAGKGGILEPLKNACALLDHKIVYNEIDPIQKQLLRNRFEGRDCNVADFNSSLTDQLNRVCSKEALAHKKHMGQFSRIIMNPPFDNADKFLLAMMDYWAAPSATIVTLYPKYHLARLKNNSATIISMLSFKSVEIEDVDDFGCGYDAKISMITLKR